MRVTNRIIIHIYAVMLICLSACGPSPNPKLKPGSMAKDRWLISGRMTNASYIDGEVLALGIDGSRYHSPIREDGFDIALPHNSTFALHFLPASTVHRDSSESIDESSIALLQFEESQDVGLRDSLRLPKVILKQTIDLGEIDIKGNEAFATINPASQIDYDHDGINDFADTDDQNNAANDVEEKKITEQIEICHISSGSAKTLFTPLAQLLHHIEHGDLMGTCQFGQR